MTQSEKLLSSFSENYFFKEFVYADLKFTPKGGTEIELADLIINLEDIVLAIQLKERNDLKSFINHSSYDTKVAGRND